MYFANILIVSLFHLLNIKNNKYSKKKRRNEL